MARLNLSLLSLLLFAILAFAGPLDLLVAERPIPAAKRSIQHAPLQVAAALEARQALTSSTTTVEVQTITETLTVTNYAIKTTTITEKVTDYAVTTKTKTGPTHVYTATVTGTKHVKETVTVTASDCTATVTPTQSVMRRAQAPKRAVGEGMLYAREFA